MKVILLKDVPNVGGAGDIKDVAPGFARNFLLPQGLAQIATSESLARLTEEKTRLRRQSEHELKEYQRLAGRIDGYELEMTMKAGKTGKLYASVTAQVIATELGKRGYKLNPTFVKCEQRIDEPGEFSVKIEFPHGLEADIKVRVEPS